MYFRLMIRPEELIGQLLLKHSCVIVPGFGGFVAQRVSAVIDPVKGVMMPPKKALLFNKQLINNDGLLTSELAGHCQVTFEEAAALLQAMIQGWNNELTKGARVHIDKVGFLFYDQEKNLCFEQDRFFNLLMESFGLGKVHFVSEKKEAKIIELTPQPTELLDPVQRGSSKGVGWKYVAAACLLPVAFYSFWIPSKTNVLESGMFSVRDFNPFFRQKPAFYNPEHLTPVKFESINGLFMGASDTYEFLPELVFPIKHDPINMPGEGLEAQGFSGHNASHQFIVGCFQSQKNVDLMISKLRSLGLDAYVFDTANGLQRVSAGGSNREEALVDIREKVASLGIQGWVYRSK